jgi:hypothetical protein
MRVSSRRIALLATALVAFGAGSATAHQRPSTETMSATGPSRIKVVTSAKTFTLQGRPGWQTIPGAVTRLVVPTGWASGLILARFNGVGQTDGSVDTFAIRIQVDGAPMEPVGKFPFGGSGEYAYPLEIDRAATAGPGVRTIAVQALIPTEWLWTFSGWTFTVEEARAN